MECFLETKVTIVTYFGWSSFGTLVGGDDDDTIGTTGTINGRCGSILENVHRLDVCRIDVGEIAHKWNSIKDNQWVITGCQ